MRRLRSLAALALALAVYASGAPARADVFGKIQLASSGFIQEEGRDGTQQQALYAHDSAISGNGQYVVFDGYFAGRAGVWRRELRPEGKPGPVEPVAVGAQVPGSEACVAQEPCDADLPSVSANGRYVSFTTTAPLTAGDRDAGGMEYHPNVYVRDMNVPASQESAYKLVSAVSGKTEGLTYEGSSADGAIAAGRSAMSESGEEVVFVTTAVSNLAACETGAPAQAGCAASSPEAPAASTPALEVAVRNLVTKETRLVSVEYDPATGQAIPDQPVSETEGSITYGAVYSQDGTPPQFPSGFDERAYDLPPSVGASISADGSTVAWMGTVVYKQARMLANEKNAAYTEPLWRRIGAGPLTPTRRVTGGSEPESPACLASGQSELPDLQSYSSPSPCQGPFVVEPAHGVWAGSVGDVIPQLSKDGYEVAFLSNAQLVSLGLDFGRSAESSGDDLYLADMHEGLTRTEALRPLTELASGREAVAPDGPILDVALSPEGDQVAFTSQRTEFPLASLAYVSEPAAVPGLAELFDVDLADNTLTRVSAGYEGGPSEHPHTEVLASREDQYEASDGALSPSFSSSGDLLAFSSTASNLVFGDGNTPPVTAERPVSSADGSDVFVVPREAFSPEPAETSVSSPPPGPRLAPEWRLDVTARSLPNGSVRLYVEVPGAGSLSAVDDSAVEKRSASRATRATARRGRSSARSAHARETVVERSVATAKRSVVASAGDLVELTLTLAPSYRALATRAGGLDGTVGVVFAAPGRATLRQRIEVSFLSKAGAAGRRARGSSRDAAAKARRGR
jgi:hypothetical protein